MSQKAPRILLAIAVGLLLLMFVLQNKDLNDAGDTARLFVPDLQSQANDVTEVRLSGSADDGSVTIRQQGEKWVVSERDGYAADVGKLRQLMIALADARIIEEKTSNPEQYSRLGVDDPKDGGSGTAILISGPDFSFSLILGDPAQGEFRYARSNVEPTSYLIDRNPEAPTSAGEWLLPDVIDIEAGRIRKVSIVHADGETLEIEKSAQDLTDFTVLDIPDGRELSYATVANGIAGAIAALALDDVRARVDATSASTVVFETWDGLTVTAKVAAEDDAKWVAFEATSAPGETAAENAAAGEAQNGVANEADRINERLAGWQYRFPDYKTNLLTRRWEDVLKSEDAD